MKVMLVAMDRAGDRFGAGLARALAERATLFGLGGGSMRKERVRLLYETSSLSREGWVDSVKTSHLLRRLLARLGEIMDRQAPEVLVLIGLGPFQTRMVGLAQSRGIQVWLCLPSSGWSMKRWAQVPAGVRVLSVYRPEAELLKEKGWDALYLGHPLAGARVTPGDPGALGLGERVLALYPGNAREELPVMVRAFKRLQKDQGYSGLLVLSRDLPSAEGERLNRMCKDVQSLVVFSGRPLEGLTLADHALVGGGMEGLEAIVTGAYPISLVKRGERVLVNALLGREAFPQAMDSEELARLVREAEPWEELRTEFLNVLGPEGLFESLSEKILEGRD